MTAAAPERQFDGGVSGDYPSNLYSPTGIGTGANDFSSVTDAHVSKFHAQGFLIVENAFSAQEVQESLDGLYHLLSGEVEEFDGVHYERASAGIVVENLSPEQKQDYVRKFMHFVNYDDRLYSLANHPQLSALVQRLIGDTPVLFQDMALLKPPRMGREKPWHQDHAYFRIELEAKVVGCWIALDEATVENGCMVIAPGSHLKGPVVHFQRRDWQICDTDVDNSGRAGRAAETGRAADLPESAPPRDTAQLFRAAPPGASVPLPAAERASHQPGRAAGAFRRRRVGRPVLNLRVAGRSTGVSPAQWFET